MFGLYAGQLEAARCLLSAGANIHVADRSGDTPLLLAAKGGHADVVTLLMSARADPHAVNKLGWSALIGAAACGSCATLRVLLASSGGGGGGFDLDASIEAAAALHEHQQPHRRGNEFNGTAVMLMVAMWWRWRDESLRCVWRCGWRWPGGSGWNNHARRRRRRWRKQSECILSYYI